MAPRSKKRASAVSAAEPAAAESSVPAMSKTTVDASPRVYQILHWKGSPYQLDWGQYPSATPTPVNGTVYASLKTANNAAIAYLLQRVRSSASTEEEIYFHGTSAGLRIQVIDLLLDAPTPDRGALGQSGWEGQPADVGTPEPEEPAPKKRKRA